MSQSARRYLRVPILMAALCLVVNLVLIGTGLTGNAQAQADHGAIPSLELASDTPGQMTISWQAPESPPTDYRITWAKSSLDWLSWTDDNEAGRGNLYPDGEATELTLENLTPGETYKVRMRSRYYNVDRSVHESSGPWSATVRQRVKDHPPAAPSGESPAHSQKAGVSPHSQVWRMAEFGGDRAQQLILPLSRAKVPDEETLCRDVKALEQERNEAQACINWRFSIQDARTKLHRPYPINA